ncbi:MAG: radical SAM protein [Candidatus Thorarchaeota archaeon]|nr:MAG: radical SAM protein [Candidatus Thorarchaeota archaeon]RLI60150.1 MAG: radical SAM protein [Candidatus Thorarchaeota archaeon]
MPREIKPIEGESLLLGKLPKGCRLCSKGAKVVLFITGLCDSSCYYCPLSAEKTGQDKMFADEMPVHEPEDILEETESIRGEGAGISGGDPLCALDRTTDSIRLLKSRFGPDFHIHLYTSKTDVETDTLRALQESGLDEIRFHPQGSDWSGIKRALSLGLTVGIEVPAIPGGTESLKEVAARAEDIGVSFLNINELEASETNFEQLTTMGMRLKDMESSSIEGSEETAREVLEWAASNLSNLTLHFCSARYKDSIQLRRRLERRLEETIREFEERDESDPLVVLGVIRGKTGSPLTTHHLEHLFTLLRHQLGVPADLINKDENHARIEMAPWILEDIHETVRDLVEFDDALDIGIAYEYPTFDRLQTLFEPL